MEDRNLHPSVRDFKEFINRHPKLRAEIRKGGSAWQEYYEKWSLLGEDDVMWKKYKESNEQVSSKDGNKEVFHYLSNLAKNIDFNKVQKQVDQLNQTFTVIQGVLTDFTKTKNDQPNRNPRVFDMFRD